MVEIRQAPGSLPVLRRPVAGFTAVLERIPMGIPMARGAISEWNIPVFYGCIRAGGRYMTFLAQYRCMGSFEFEACFRVIEQKFVNPPGGHMTFPTVGGQLAGMDVLMTGGALC